MRWLVTSASSLMFKLHKEKGYKMKYLEKFAIWFSGFALWIFPPADDYKHSDYEE